MEGGTVAGSKVLKISEEVQFGKEEGESSVALCAITAPAGEWPYTGVLSESGKDYICFGPIQMWATQWDGVVDWNCNGHEIHRHICYGDPDIFFVDTIFGNRYLEKGKEHVSIVEQTKE